MRARSIGALLLGLAACGSPAPAAVPLATTPVARPADVIAEVSLGDGDAALAALRALLPGDESAPTHVADVVRSACPGVPRSVAARVHSAARLRAVLRRGEVTPALAFVVHVRTDPGAQPLGSDVTLAAPDADGARLLTTTTGAAALRGDVLVCANDQATLQALLPYLTHTLAAAPIEAGLSLHVPDEVAARDVRTQLEHEVAATAGTLRDSARRELAAHADPPALGDPLALVDVVAADLSALLAYLPDLGDLTAHVDAAPTRAHLAARFAVHPGSPLALVLGDRPTVSRDVVASLPTGTALGVVCGDRGVDRVWPWLDGLARDVARVAGERLPAAAREGVIETSVVSLGAARGDAVVGALGASEDGSFALVAARHAVRSPDFAVLVAALRVPYVSALAEAATGVDVAHAPLEERADAHDERIRFAPPGDDASAPTLTLATRGTSPAGTTWAVGLARERGGDAARSPTRAVAAALDGQSGTSGPPAGLTGDPDVARAVATLPATALAYVVVDPPRVVRLLRGDGRSDPTGSTATIVSLSYGGGTLALDAVAAPRALPPLVATVAALLADSP